VAAGVHGGVATQTSAAGTASLASVSALRCSRVRGCPSVMSAPRRLDRAFIKAHVSPSRFRAHTYDRAQRENVTGSRERDWLAYWTRPRRPRHSAPRVRARAGLSLAGYRLSGGRHDLPETPSGSVK
jgi:hypothetical protein